MADDPSSLCHCSVKNTVHVHCNCQECDGKAVNYRTQQLHLARYGPARKKKRQDTSQPGPFSDDTDHENYQGKY